MTDIYEKQRLLIQRKFDDNKRSDWKKKYGQFATPTLLAKDIINYGLSLQQDIIEFMDPAFGSGSFYSALLSTNICYNSAVGFEIDSDYIDEDRVLWKNTQLSLIEGDFLNQKVNKKCNFLICNPPYVRHHLIESDRKIMLKHMVKEELNIDISGLSGLHCYFMLLCHKWLSDGAISGWLIPSEFMDVDYGIAIKEYLLNRVQLIRIHRFAPTDVQFDDALVSSAVVWFKNNAPDPNKKIIFTYGGTHNKPKISKEINPSILKLERKWSRFPIESERKINDNVPLSKYFIVKRGIATGDNKFFIISREEANKLKIPKKYIRPILPSPRYLKVNKIESDEEGYPILDNQLILIDCKDDIDTVKEASIELYNYLKKKEEENNFGQLCKKRPVWYYLEERTPSFILCTYMGRGSTNPFKFVWNDSDAIVTNSFLMMYPTEYMLNTFGDSKKVLYHAWEFLSNLPTNIILDESRIYGGGLKKIEPRELMNIDVRGIENFLNLSKTQKHNSDNR